MMIQTMVRLDPKVRAAAEIAAKAEGRTLSGWIKRLVHQALRIETVDTPPGRPRKAVAETPEITRLKAALKPKAVAGPSPGGDHILVKRCAQHKREQCLSCAWSPETGYPEGKALGGPSVRYV